MTLFALRVGRHATSSHAFYFIPFRIPSVDKRTRPYIRSGSPHANVFGVTRTTRRRLPDDLDQRIAQTDLYDRL